MLKSDLQIPPNEDYKILNDNIEIFKNKISEVAKGDAEDAWWPWKVEDPGIKEINAVQADLVRGQIEISPTQQCEAMIVSYKKDPSKDRRCPLCNLPLLVKSGKVWEYLKVPVGKQGSVRAEPVKIDCDHWIPVKYVYLFLCQKQKITKTRLKLLADKLAISVKSGKSRGRAARKHLALLRLKGEQRRVGLDSGRHNKPIFGETSSHPVWNRADPSKLIQSMKNMPAPIVTINKQIQILNYVHDICNQLKSDIPGIALYEVTAENTELVKKFANNRKSAARGIADAFKHMSFACIKSNKHNLSGILGPWILTRCNNIFLSKYKIKQHHYN